MKRWETMSKEEILNRMERCITTDDKCDCEKDSDVIKRLMSGWPRCVFDYLREEVQYQE